MGELQVQDGGNISRPELLQWRIMRIQIPSHVEYIIGKLNQNGYEAFAVGGCVRVPFWEDTGGLGYYHLCQTGTGEGSVPPGRLTREFSMEL